jgi:hypothetical protein
MKWYFDESGITVVGKKKSVTLLRDHPQYNEIKNALSTEGFNEETIMMLLDPEVIKAREAVMQ